MYPFKTKALFVKQPFGEFIVAIIPARVLLDTAYSDRLQATRNADGTYSLDGSQRALIDERLKDIGRFIGTSSVAFPNALILAANFREADGLAEEDESKRWKFISTNEHNCGELTIPEPIKLAPIIDGQHRLFGFSYLNEHVDRLGMPLVCSIYFGLPKPYQAAIFATINANQRPVSKSQTYELFGYNVEEEDPKFWTPEKLSVFLTRKLNSEESSPFHKHIEIAAENDFGLSMSAARKSGTWAVSTATVVEGILKLVSINPKLDAYDMDGRLSYLGKKRSSLAGIRMSEKTPLRQFFLEGNDQTIYLLIRNYFHAVAVTLWKKAVPGSYINKTVGVQALFDLARPLFQEAIQKQVLGVDFFAKKLQPAQSIDFADTYFQASGTGRTRIRKMLEFATGLGDLSDTSSEVDASSDSANYRRLTVGA